MQLLSSVRGSMSPPWRVVEPEPSDSSQEELGQLFCKVPNLRNLILLYDDNLDINLVSIIPSGVRLLSIMTPCSAAI